MWKSCQGRDSHYPVPNQFAHHSLFTLFVTADWKSKTVNSPVQVYWYYSLELENVGEELEGC